MRVKRYGGPRLPEELTCESVENPCDADFDELLKTVLEGMAPFLNAFLRALVQVDARRLGQNSNAAGAAFLEADGEVILPESAR